MLRIQRNIITALALVCSSVGLAEVKISGGAAPMNNIFKKIQDPIKSKKNISIILEEIGPEIALQQLDKGQIDAAAAGVTIDDWFKLAQEKGITLTSSKDKFKARRIGMDIIKVVTNPKNNIKNLSADQLKGIFTGKIKNWKDVGGADIPVVVVFGEKISGTNKVFQKNVLAGGEFEKSETVGTVVEIIAKVASKAGAIGLATSGSEYTGVETPTIPEIGRPISLLTLGAPKPELINVLEFIEAEGKQYIGK